MQVIKPDKKANCSTKEDADVSTIFSTIIIIYLSIESEKLIKIFFLLHYTGRIKSHC